MESSDEELLESDMDESDGLDPDVEVDMDESDELESDELAAGLFGRRIARIAACTCSRVRESISRFQVVATTSFASTMRWLRLWFWLKRPVAETREPAL